VLFAPIAPNMYIGGDSVVYYNLGKKMIMAPSLSTIVTPYRVPLYPFLVASFVPGPDEFPDGYLAPEIVLGVHHLMVFQSVLGVISVIFVYLLFISCNTGVVLAFFGALFFALNPQIFLWERTMLSEGVVISFFVIFLYACVCVLRKTTWYSLLFFSIFGTICFLTRPANLLIPLTVFPFIIWNNKKRNKQIFYK